MALHTRPLGQTGLDVSILGAGSSQFRDGPPETCALLLEQALDLGITYYDTARSYKNGEEAVGLLPDDARKRLVVATKTGARGGARCIQDLQTSLRTLRRDWVDVWMTHMVGNAREYELCTELGGFCDVAAAAKSAGLVRATGASFHTSTDVILRAIHERAFDVVMFQFNLIGRETVIGSSIASYRDVLLPAAREAGIGVVVMKVLAGGEMRHGAPGLLFPRDPATGRNELAGAVRYAAMCPDIATAVVGMSSTDELLENVSAVRDIGDDHGAVFDDWTQQAEALLHGECTRCGACLGVCPHSIEIPKIFRQYDQYRFLGMRGAARYKYGQIEVSGDACQSCRRCQDACPEDFNIAALLSEAHIALSKPGLASAG